VTRPPRRAPSGHLTPKGYRRIWSPAEGRYRMAHDLVWESLHGPIPPGYQVHHVDGDKTNNAPENLVLLDALTHKRIHSGCVLRDGEWYKPCTKCGEMQKVEGNYYVRKDGSVSPWCKACCVAAAVISKREQRARKRAAREQQSRTGEEEM
jgi:ribosomal protein L24E